ncbi:hypothetical protein [Streptomyces sp. 351MFTsu5.1]|uniref:hypothetical protein n=1 Tax=Streptomyces sp. 351MFTsu5.1 TaxID=1172180 RepID=UPI00037E83D3|nr:hypothetical protein [Streptomyces sp. 351MFTsu5.1]
MPLPQPPSRTGRTPAVTVTRRLARGAAVGAGLALMPLTAACGGGADEASGERKASKSPAISAVRAGVVAPAKVEVIAGLTGCKAKIRIEADELRQGVCHTEDVDYLVTTFPEERFKEAWLESASVYRADFLVGPRWIVSAKIDALRKFRERTGGEIVSHSGMGPTGGR